MAAKQSRLVTNSDRWSYLWLSFGNILLMFSNGRWSIPIATWLFPVFLIHFFRTQKTVFRLIVGAVFFVTAYIFIYWQILSLEALSPMFRISSGTAVGLLFFLPFLADRLLTPQLKGIISTLVFPFSWVTIEYLISLISGSWGALAYTQYGNLPLMQVVSLTGIWGISFLITWFASIVNFLWENEFVWSKIRRLVWLYSAILVLVLFYGGVRLSLFPSASGTIKIASILNPNKSFVSRFFQPDFKERESIRNQTTKEQGDFLKRSREAARQSAKIVVWQEYAVSLLKEDEASFIKRGCELANQEGIYLVMVYATLPQDFPTRPWKNKLVWIDPKGNVLQEYTKSKPAPPLEPIQGGDGIVPIITTSFGKIASVICADQNYPNLIRQVGKARAGLLLVPSLDWKSVSPLHTQMGIFRAIENGCAMVKSTGEGLSVAVDYQGRILTTLDYWNTKEKVMISNVSTKGVTTVYSQIGDLLAWLCMIGLVAIIGLTVFGRRATGIRRNT